LLVIDVQHGVVELAYDRDAVVANVARLVDGARAAGVPVVWVQHEDDDLPEGSVAWQIVDELVPREGESRIHKRFGDAFEDTALGDRLTELNVGSLVVAGAQTDFCVRSTLHGAVARGYDALLVSDAHTTNDAEWDGVQIPAVQIIAHTNMYWHWHRVPDRTGGTVSTAEVDWRD
jgi:nicotinamidase-related amidase